MAWALVACGDNHVVIDACLFVRCVGADCVEGELLAAGDARRLAVGDTRLFAFDRDGTLYEAPREGGEFTMVVATDAFIQSLRTAGDQLVWANNFGADFYSPATGVRRLTDDAITFGFAMDRDAIYYGGANNLLVRLGLGDAQPVSWAATQATARGVAIGGDDLYFTNCESVFRARNEPFGPQEPIARGGCPLEIAAGSRTVAWTEHALDDGNNTIVAYDIASGTVSDLVTTLPGEPVLHVDDTHVYYGGGGAICRIPVGGGVPQKVAIGTAFAFDATGIYWSLADEVRRADKPRD